MVFEIINWVIAIITLGALGWVIGEQRTRPAGPVVYVLLLVVAILGLFVGKEVILVGVDNYRLYLSRAVFSCCVGVCIGSATHSLRLSRHKSV